MGAFAFNWLTRVWSVAIPAVLLTLGLDLLGSRLDPPAYDGWWYVAHDPGAMLFFGLSFSTESGLLPFRLGSNGPYWSLGAALFERRLGVFRAALRRIPAYLQRRKVGVSDGVALTLPARVIE